jgi:hypothetical protein
MKYLFCYFKTSLEIICLPVMMYVRFPLSLRQVEDLLHGRGIDVGHETVRAWWNRFDGESGLWRNSGAQSRCRKSPPFKPQSVIISTKTVILTTEAISN